jgi:hypothetical protein
MSRSDVVRALVLLRSEVFKSEVFKLVDPFEVSPSVFANSAWPAPWASARSALDGHPQNACSALASDEGGVRELMPRVRGYKSAASTGPWWPGPGTRGPKMLDRSDGDPYGRFGGFDPRHLHHSAPANAGADSYARLNRHPVPARTLTRAPRAGSPNTCGWSKRGTRETTACYVRPYCSGCPACARCTPTPPARRSSNVHLAAAGRRERLRGLRPGVGSRYRRNLQVSSIERTSVPAGQAIVEPFWLIKLSYLCTGWTMKA